MEDALKYSVIPAIASLFLLTTSCSWYRDAQRSMVAEDEKAARSNRPVPRSQYDQLLVKYEELSKKYEALKENPNEGKSSLVDEIQKSKSENFANTSGNVETETVNLFPQNTVTSSEPLSAPKDLEEELALYRKGISLKPTNPGEATKIFQQIESSSSPAVKARAKFQLGELMFAQKQYDLALQVFEEIINKQAQSGVVLDALRFAVICSDKLGIKNKRDQYSSMLNDVFEAN